MVEVGFTVVEPDNVLVEKEPGVMAIEVAFETFQLRVDVPAEATIVEDAEKEEMEGRPTAFSELIAQKVDGVDWFQYSVAIQFGLSVTFATLTSVS